MSEKTIETLKAEIKELRVARKAILEAYEESIQKVRGLQAEKKNNQAKLNELGKELAALKPKKAK